MGWIFTHRDKGISNAEWFGREFGDGFEVLADATIKGTWYAAVKRNSDGKVAAVVALTRWVPGDYHNFGWKDMDESMGPGEAEAPAKVLDLLDEPYNDYAVEWRARCRANLDRKANRPKVAKGDTVHFAHAMRFSNGLDLDTFTFIERNTFRSAWGRVRIPGWRDLAYEVVAA